MKKIVCVVMALLAVVSSFAAVSASAATTPKVSYVTTAKLKYPTYLKKTVGTKSVKVVCSKETGFKGIFAILWKSGKKSAIATKAVTGNTVSFTGLAKGKYTMRVQTLGSYAKNTSGSRVQYISKKCNPYTFTVK